MKLILFLSLLGAFVLDTLTSIRISGLIGLTVTNVTMLGVLLVLLATDVFGGRLSGKSLPGVKFAIITIVAVILSLFYSKYNGIFGGAFLDNFRQAKTFVFVPATLYVLAFLLIDTREQGERFLLILVLSLGVLNVISAIGAQLGMEVFRVKDIYATETESMRRLEGFTGNPNKTAYLTCILIAFQYYFYKFHSSRIVRYLMAIIMVGGIVVVLLSGSRGGLLVLIVVFMGLAYRLRDMRVFYGAVLLIPLLLGLLLFTESAFLNTTFERMARLTSGDTAEVTSGRNIIWSALLSDFMSNPVGVLFGNGFGAAKFMGIRAEPHNIYLMVLVEFGIIGCGIFLYFVWSVFRYVVNVRLDGSDTLRASVLASGYVVVFAWIFTTLIGVLDLIWLTIGVSVATLFVTTRKTGRGREHVPGEHIDRKELGKIRIIPKVDNRQL